MIIQPQFETMLEHYLLYFNDGGELADNCLHYGNMVHREFPIYHSISL